MSQRRPDDEFGDELDPPMDCGDLLLLGATWASVWLLGLTAAFGSAPLEWLL